LVGKELGEFVISAKRKKIFKYGSLAGRRLFLAAGQERVEFTMYRHQRLSAQKGHNENFAFREIK
jgi:hypothetical protein